MPLSRLENFLKNAEGNILYVSPSDFDSTDSYENKGNSLARPYKTIQRALLEAARFSYQVGRNNDKIDRTTILVYPGTHYIDNRPGFSIDTSATLKRRTGSGSGATWTTSGATITELGSSYNTDLNDINNDLYKLNSVDGGVIMPRGTSIIGLDLRKTKIRPLYVPDPLDDYIVNSSIFNVTGTCYFTAFTFLDADPNRSVYKNYNNTSHVPNFSHHKLASFVYADGVNQVKLGTTETGLTDLQMYYNKISLVYGTASGRSLADYPTGVDFEPSVDEYRIVGNLNANALGITSIRSGDGITPSSTITITTASNHGLYVDTPILVSKVGIDTTSYNGSFVVKEVVGLTTFTYTSISTPVVALPSDVQIQNSQVIVEADSVSSASPYIFNCSLRSAYGLCGMFADGNRATGFKSMVVAQFTGISLQKDDNAFIDYNTTSKSFKNNDESSNSPLHTYSGSIYKPSYENYHIKVSNGAFIQCVSIFAIGFARHFVAESGGDMSITNSNSNFGAVSLESIGFRKDSFDKDNTGYITHIIPPREVTIDETEVGWLSLDTNQIINNANASRLYLYSYKNKDIIPPHQVDSYRIGAKQNELLNLTVTVGAALTTYTAPILMQSPDGTTFSANKISKVGRTAGINSITNDTFTLTVDHKFYNGEKVRIFSDNAESPSNIELNKVYYIGTTGISNQVKLSPTYSDTIAATPRTITGVNNLGGNLTIISSITDKQPGELAHPVQYDLVQGSWYINSSLDATNQIYTAIVGLGTTALGDETSTTFIKRKLDNRSLTDRIYKLRYVIPKEATNARPPVAGFIIQESSTTTIDSPGVISGDISNSIQLKNPKIITNASYGGNVITITTELPHNFIVGDTVKIQNITSTNNISGAASSVFNGSFSIASIPSSKTFTISDISINPGTFTNNTNQRDTSQQVNALPTVSRERYKDSYFIYRIDEIRKHIPGSATTGQDGIYHLTVMASNVSPTLANVGYGISLKNYNQDVRNLYPQMDRDNYNSDPDATISYANVIPLGTITSNDKRNSVTKEALNSFILENTIGFGITDASVSGTAVTFYTDREHNLNSIKTLSLTSGGSGYGSTTLYSTSLVPGTTTGTNAAVKATLSAGSVSGVSIVDGGSAYGVGNTMSVVGGTSLATVQVTAINNNIGDAVQVIGVSSDKYNGTFKITGIPGPKSITVYNSNNVGQFINRTDGLVPIIAITAKGNTITSLDFSSVQTGIATVTTSNSHGLLVGNKFTITGTGHTIYDSSFVVNQVVGLTTFTFNVGKVSATKTYTGGGSVLRQEFSANALAIGEGELNLGGRISYIYAGISTTLSGALTSSSTSISITSVGGFRKGDFIQINSEILRIANDACTTVLRGQLGTVSASADNGTLVKKVRVIPIQLHRPSYLRASGHTFEYLGYGPGNYSTGMPQKQDKILSEDEIIVSQAKEQDGGTIVYSGMNDLGEFYSGAKKLTSVTGEEEVFDAPVFTYTGDDANTDSTKRLSGVFDDMVVRDRITIEGGENNNQTSQFYGPVNFTQKVTSTSNAGLEVKNLFVKGSTAQAKLITVGISTPTSSDIPGVRSGDISLLATPQTGGYLGHTYADGDWKRFGLVSRETNSTYIRIDKLGIGQTTTTFDGTNPLEVNGTAKFKNITVTESVTFPAQQTFSNLAFDGINIYGTATFPGTNSSGSITSSHTQRHTQGISQLYNLEVTGTAATFTNAKLTLQESLNSTYTGVSTFAGTLKVGFATITNAYVSGVTTSVTLNATTGIITSLTATNQITTGIATVSSSGVDFKGTTGQTKLQASATASGTLTLPATTDTLVGKVTTDILTNKSIAASTNTISGLTNTNLSGTAGITNANLANSTISGISLGGTLADLTLGTHLSFAVGSAYTGGTARQINVDASSTGTNNIVARDASGNFSASTITASLTGTATSTTNIPNLTGDITSINTFTSIAAGVIVDADINASAGIVDTKLATISTALKVSNSATTATNANTPSAIVARDASGNFSAGTITATSGFSGNATSATTAGTATTANGLNTSNSYQVNSLGIGTAPSGTTGEIRATNDITAFYSSDKRLKENINPIPNALEKVLQISGNTFDWKSGFSEIHSHSGTDVGVIAQEVEKVLPQIVTNRENGYKAVQYEKIVALLIEAVKELQEEVNQLKGHH
jgi:hypothetical protein